MSSSRRALLTFAFVSEALKSHNDIVVGLSPLFNPIAADLSGKIFEPQELCNELAKRYDLPVSYDVAEFLSFGLHKASLLKRREIGSTDLSFFWCAPPHSQRNEQIDLENKIQQLADKVMEFSVENPSLLSWGLSKENALDLIFDWIIDQDKELREAESVYENRAPVAAPEPPRTRRLKSEQDYFCTRFITWLSKNTEELYDTLSDLGNAILVSEVVLELRTPTITPQPGRELYIYLDAPICMDVLGCSGKARKEQTSYLIERLRQLGANILIYSHSLEELKENLKAVLKNPQHERSGPTATALLLREIPEDFLWGVLRDAESHLQQNNIALFDVGRTPLPPVNMQVFPEEYYLGVLSKLQQHYNRFEAAERDALSAALIMRRRARQKSNDLFRTKHTMITRNPMVAAVTKTYCRDVELLSAEHIGPFMHVRQAAGIVWLAVGTQQKREISRRQLVVSCSRALESAPGIIQQFRRKLREIRPENIEAFDALITEPRNLQIAMDFAQGTEARAVESNPELLIEKMTEQLTSEAHAQFADERRKLIKRHKSEIEESNKKQNELAQQIKTLEQQKEKIIDDQTDALLLLFRRFRDKVKIAIILWKCLIAAVAFAAIFITSSILLESVDKSLFAGWTLVLSGMAGMLGAVTMFVDPRSLIEATARKWLAKKFLGEVRSMNLAEAHERIELDWASGSYRKKQVTTEKKLLV